MKKRIIPSILLNNGTQVSLSQKFKPWRTVGTLVQNLRLHIQRQADELLIINLTQAKLKSYYISERILKLVRQEVDIPISYCGAIKNKTDASECINSGFDKVFITTEFLDNPNSLKEIVSLIGSQSVGVAIPYVRSGNNEVKVWDYHNSSFYSHDFLEIINYSIQNGAGELLLIDVERNGSLEGLDKNLIYLLEKIKPSVPILICGGAGKLEHFAEVLENQYVQGVVASSIFSLSHETPSTIRTFCENSGIKMRRILKSINTEE